MPDNLIAEPTLLWRLDAGGGQQQVEVSYLTNNLNWKSDYVMYDRYLDVLPVRAVTGAREALRGLRGLGLGVGLGDQFLHISSGTLELSRRLGEERIPHQLDVYAGDHRQLVSRRLEEVVFHWIAERLVAGND